MAFHERYRSNAQGRDFVLGDLHGMVDALHDALDEASFDPRRDRCFCVGDLVDRGPDSLAAAKLVTEPWFHAVRGNHEDMLIRVVDGERGQLIPIWRRNGGAWGLSFRRPNRAARQAAELCRNLPHAITLMHQSGWRIGICHAQCPVDDWEEIESLEQDHVQTNQMLWGRSRIVADNPDHVDNVDLTVHGHTIIDRPLLTRNALFIDTGAAIGGPLTLLCLDDWIANSSGKP